jgi:hypothetical protein
MGNRLCFELMVYELLVNTGRQGPQEGLTNLLHILFEALNLQNMLKK